MLCMLPTFKSCVVTVLNNIGKDMVGPGTEVPGAGSISYEMLGPLVIENPRWVEQAMRSKKEKTPLIQRPLKYGRIVYNS